MEQLYFATKNKGKFISVSNRLSKYDISVVQLAIDMPEPSDDMQRHGMSAINSLLAYKHNPDELEYVSKSKVLYAFEKIGKPVVALDSGCYITSLDGFPGAYVNVALKNKDFGLEGILNLIHDKPGDCVFHDSFAYFDSILSEPICFKSKTEGMLLKSPKGSGEESHWSDLWKAFMPKGYDKTLSEMSEEELEQWRKTKHDRFAIDFVEWYSTIRIPSSL